jgi:hypothetical protein
MTARSTPAPAAGLPADPAPVSAPAAGAGAAAPSPARADEAINLGATVLPIMLRTYWKQGLGLVVLVALIRVLVRRTRS